MIETDTWLNADYGDINEISPKIIDLWLPGLWVMKKYLRDEKGNPSPEKGRLTSHHADVIFREYLIYLAEHFTYTLGTGFSFWQPTGVNVNAPTGNCQTVAQNFLFLLWAYSFDLSQMGMRIISGGGPQENEKLVNKSFPEVVQANIWSGFQDLLGPSRGTRGFRVDPRSGNLMPLNPARNPFVFHAFSHLKFGTSYKFYDARTGLKYANGGEDYFEVYRRGADYIEFTDPNPNGYTSFSSLIFKVFYDESRPKRRIYELPKAFDNHQVVSRGVGAYAEGGNWIFVDESDWTAIDDTGRPRTYTKPPEHVRNFLLSR